MYHAAWRAPPSHGQSPESQTNPTHPNRPARITQQPDQEPNPVPGAGEVTAPQAEPKPCRSPRVDACRPKAELQAWPNRPGPLSRVCSGRCHAGERQPVSACDRIGRGSLLRAGQAHRTTGDWVIQHIGGLRWRRVAGHTPGPIGAGPVRWFPGPETASGLGSRRPASPTSDPTGIESTATADPTALTLVHSHKTYAKAIGFGPRPRAAPPGSTRGLGHKPIASDRCSAWHAAPGRRRVGPNRSDYSPPQANPDRSAGALCCRCAPGVLVCRHPFVSDDANQVA